MTTRPGDSTMDAHADLDQALGQLHPDVQPERDLWPAVEARLEPRAARPQRHGWWWAAAAAVLLVVGSALVTASLVRREPPAIARQVPAAGDVRHAAATFGPGQALDPAYEKARDDLVRSLSQRIDRLPPDARRQLEKNLQEMRRASAAINEALELKPGDPLLEELLLNAYQDQLAVLASVNQLAGGNGSGATTDASRIQL